MLFTSHISSGGNVCALKTKSFDIWTSIYLCQCIMAKVLLHKEPLHGGMREVHERSAFSLHAKNGRL